MSLDSKEIESLVILSGKRLIHLENEIFSDERCTITYIHALTRSTISLPTVAENIKYQFSAYRYAKDVIKGRWLEAEPYIMTGRISVCLFYAQNVIRGRWPEAEHLILSEHNKLVNFAWIVQYLLLK